MMPIDIKAMTARLSALAAEAPDCSYSCAQCRDTGVVEAAVSGVIREGRCPSCRPVGMLAGVPKPFVGVTLEGVRLSHDNRYALQAAREFASTPTPRDLLLYGAVGVGKTHLAIAAARARVRAHGVSGLFVRWPMTIHQLQPGSLDDQQRRQFEQRLFTVPLLVVDDIGAERDVATEFTRRLALLMYEARGDAGLVTVLTTNLTLERLATQQDDDRLSSRLAGRCDVVEITGGDQRLVRHLRAV